MGLAHPEVPLLSLDPGAHPLREVRFGPGGELVVWRTTDDGGAIVRVHDPADGRVRSERAVARPVALLPAALVVVEAGEGDR